MKLFASLTSPYARKIRVIVAEKGIACDLVVAAPWEADSGVPEFNPLGKVPALIADDGETWFDSPVVAGYLELIGGGPALLPTEPMAALLVRQAEALADGIMDATVAVVLEARRPQAHQSADLVARQQDKIRRGLAALEARTATRRGLNGDALSLGDIAAGCLLGYLDLRMAELDWRSDHPALAALAERLFARPSFIATVPPRP